MDDRANMILNSAKDLYEELEEKTNILPFVKVTGNSLLIKQCKMITPVQVIINQSIQTGNYKRAAKYLIVLKKIIQNLDVAEKDVRDVLTSRII